MRLIGNGFWAILAPMKLDYIIVGFGLAGLSFCEQLEQHQKSYVVIDDDSQRASKTAAGVYNPTNLKRFTAVWNAKAHTKALPPFFEQIKARIGVGVNQQIPVYRRIASIEEQNDWVVASDNPKLTPFLSTDFVVNDNPAVDARHGFGQVLQTGRIDTNTLLDSYKGYLRASKKFIEASFIHDKLGFSENGVDYEEFTAKHIVFCEGFGLMKNPFFDYLPLKGNKGEYLVIKARRLKMDFILKASLFVVPLGDDLYQVGATFNREDKTNKTTEGAKQDLLEKLGKTINCDFEVVDQVAGIRPTTGDRRPLLGTHPEHGQLAILNGFGSRGILMSPSLSHQLYDHLENRSVLDPETDIKRFERRYLASKRLR